MYPTVNHLASEVSQAHSSKIYGHLHEKQITVSIRDSVQYLQ